MIQLPQQKPIKTQLRLILEKDWVKELDLLARTRFVSRLAVIRYYLRQMMDKDLAELTENLEKRRQFKLTQEAVSSHIEDWER